MLMFEEVEKSSLPKSLDVLDIPFVRLSRADRTTPAQTDRSIVWGSDVFG